MFWSSEKLREELPRLALVDPYEHERVEHGAYELSLGPEAAVSGESTRIKLEGSDQVCIPPGQFAHLLTEEVVAVPLNALALISIKSRVKQTGLINVSGFHVDPGFKGRLVFSVYNAGVQPIVLSRGEPVFLIWFADLDRPTGNKYDGNHQGQKHISDSATMALHGTAYSPPELAHRLSDLEARVTRWFAGAKWILLTLVSGTIALTLRDCGEWLPARQTKQVIEQKAAAPADSAGHQLHEQVQGTRPRTVGPSRVSPLRGREWVTCFTLAAAFVAEISILALVPWPSSASAVIVLAVVVIGINLFALVVGMSPGAPLWLWRLHAQWTFGTVYLASSPLRELGPQGVGLAGLALAALALMEGAQPRHTARYQSGPRIALTAYLVGIWCLAWIARSGIDLGANVSALWRAWVG